jgi:arginase
MGTKMRGRPACRRPARRPTASWGWRCGCLTPTWPPRLRGVLPRIRARDVVAVGPRDGGELAAAGVRSLAGQLRALIRPAELAASGGAAAACLPAPWWLHTDLDVLATTELAAVDYPQPGGLTWNQLGDITSAALAAEGCAGWSVCIYNPDLDPGRDRADSIITYLAQAITMADHRLTDGVPDPAGSMS